MTDSEYRPNRNQAAGRTRIGHAGSGHQQSYFVFRLLWAMARGTGSARQMRRLGALTLFAGLSLLYVYWNAGYYRMVPLFFAVLGLGLLTASWHARRQERRLDAIMAGPEHDDMPPIASASRRSLEQNR